MLGSAVFRTGVTPGGALAGPWVRNPLWAAARAVPSLDLRFADNKSLVDATTGSNLVTFTRASSGTFVGSNGVLQTAVTDAPRFDHNPTTGESLGLLVEEQRTNSIRNNTGVGAAAGTPGTVPTHSSYFANGGLTTSIIGTGTQNGINYVDFRLNGTTTTTFLVYAFDNVAASASAGQAWAESFWVSIVGGSAANISTMSVNLRQSGGSSTVFDTVFTPTATFTRVSGVATLGTGATGVTGALAMSFSSGAAIDITFRIGLPQLEQGAFATSPILTSTAAATRSADVASITGSAFSGWYSQSEGTMFVDVNSAPVNNIVQLSYDVSDGTVNERFFHRRTNGGTVQVALIDGGVAQGDIGGVPLAASARYKTGFAYKLNDLELLLNGGGSSTDTSATIPTVNQLHIGQSFAAVQQVNGTIRRLTYWPQRLANSTLQTLTQ